MEGFKARPTFQKDVRYKLDPSPPKPREGHVPFINLASGRHQCRVCFVSSASKLKGKCQFASSHSMHGMWTVGPFTFCCDCGAHTRVSLRKLAVSCPRKVTTVAMGHALGLLKQGLHPTLGYFLGTPSPVAHDVLPLLPVQRGSDSEPDSD